MTTTTTQRHQLTVDDNRDDAVAVADGPVGSGSGSHDGDDLTRLDGTRFGPPGHRRS